MNEVLGIVDRLCALLPQAFEKVLATAPAHDRFARFARTKS